ncbi:13822_t:CDS:1 [Entrophospora sp. SA101]|nr:12712_t:CDS:1 [Entrophospora sp. SA101]CAJ0641268.1 9491_t:CDS:1 [Entrophospora sp. SA101]CAJ0752434.1 13822_t:CDS:1 [Entrophospora sp. SA101]CAJ0827537.1 13607_t:CDS:1 [Entrophospora sp. SA101]CAJ0838836.1 691_t:CDS:1 [Entrophospora sp. SA101]
MIGSSRRKRMRSDAAKLSPEDYKDIMQYRDIKSKPLEELRLKYHISISRLYQIWRGEEFGRVEWYQPVSEDYPRPVKLPEVQSTISPEIHPNRIEGEVLHLESSILPNERIKKRRPKSKIVRSSDSTLVSNDFSDDSTKKINQEELNALYEREAKRDKKNIENMTRLLT